MAKTGIPTLTVRPVVTSYHRDVAVDCYVRASVAGHLVDDVIETLRAHEAEGVVDEFAVESWPASVRLSGSVEESPVLGPYERFRSWADGADVSLEPAFTRKERSTIGSDAVDRILVPPVLCLAVHVDGTLVTVAPHHTGRAAYTVEDALADVESLRQVTTASAITELATDHPIRSALTVNATEDAPLREAEEEHPPDS